MGTGRTMNKAPITRPKKSEGERERRINTHRKRLLGLGLTEADVGKLNPKEMRTLLRKPAKLSVA